jgi:hypothetical protein
MPKAHGYETSVLETECLNCLRVVHYVVAVLWEQRCIIVKLVTQIVTSSLESY